MTTLTYKIAGGSIFTPIEEQRQCNSLTAAYKELQALKQVYFKKYADIEYRIFDMQGDIEIGNASSMWQRNQHLLLRAKNKKVKAYSLRQRFANTAVLKHEGMIITTSSIDFTDFDLSNLPTNNFDEEKRKSILNAVSSVLKSEANSIAATFDITKTESIMNFNRELHYFWLKNEKTKTAIKAEVLLFFLKNFKNVTIKIDNNNGKFQPIFIYSNNKLICVHMPFKTF